MQLAPRTGLNASITWTKQTFSGGNSTAGCNAECVQATLTTNKCGVTTPMIQPLSFVGAAAKVGSATGLAHAPAYLWSDGFQTAFTDELGLAGALAATGPAAGLASIVVVPASAVGTVVRASPLWTSPASPSRALDSRSFPNPLLP